MTIAFRWFNFGEKYKSFFFFYFLTQNKTFAILTLSFKAALRSSTVSLALLRIRAQFLANFLAPAVI